MSESEPVIDGPAAGSLEERIALRRQRLEQRDTEVFDVPGMEGIVLVEMRVLGGKRQFAAIAATERIHDDYRKVVQTASDLILAATVAFHKVLDDGDTALAEGLTWKKIAQAVDPTLEDATLARKGGGRVALARALGESSIMELMADWREWTRTRGSKIARELEADF